MISSLRLLAVLLVSCSLAGADIIREALVNLCDPAKIETITANQDANSRVLQICYWLEMARQDGRDPASEMHAVMMDIGWGADAKGNLTAGTMVENWAVASRHGCLDQAGMADLRRGDSPTIRIGRNAGDKLGVYHLIPLSVYPELDTILANLRLAPMQSYHYKFNPIGWKQVEWLRECYAAGLLSNDDVLRLLPFLETAVRTESNKGKCGTSWFKAQLNLHSIKEELRRRGAL